MSKKINCEACSIPLGEIATGSTIKKGAVNVCEGCYELVAMEILIGRSLNKSESYRNFDKEPSFG